MDHALGVVSKKTLPKPRLRMFIFFLPMFSSGSYIVLGFSFGSMINFELIFVYGMRYGLNFSLLLCI